ncbi:MAG: hypothetical protein ABIU54_09635 [Candidatus Eisenbacteria bacterium]
MNGGKRWYMPPAGAMQEVVSDEVEGLAEQWSSGVRIETPDEGAGSDAGTRGQHP